MLNVHLPISFKLSEYKRPEKMEFWQGRAMGAGLLQRFEEQLLNSFAPFPTELNFAGQLSVH